MEQPGWSAIVVNYNGASFLGPCLAALERNVVPPRATLVVDNASTDDSLLELLAFPRAEALPQSRNLGFAGGANAGLRAALTDYVVILNPDVEVAPDFGSALLAAFGRHPALAAAGPLLTYPESGRVQHAGGIIDRPLMTTRHRGYGEIDLTAYGDSSDVDYVTGGAMVLRLDAVKEVGAFDERFSPVYYEDVDLCVRLRAAGWRVMFVPALRANHHEGVTLKQDQRYFRHLHRNRIRFALKHLSHTEWSREFVPAELARLRHELATTTQAEEVETSGAAAIEVVLRGLDNPESWDTGTVLPVWPIPTDTIGWARGLVDVAGTPPSSRNPVTRWLHNKVMDLGPRRYVDPAFTQQSAFNTAVVQALGVHERLHREQTAALLLLALDALGRFEAIAALERDAPRVESDLAP
jgi:O-antigen biosynthesis protein